jgi:hypothetical protein
MPWLLRNTPPTAVQNVAGVGESATLSHPGL